MTDADLQHPAVLTTAQTEAWQRDGFLLLPGFKTRAEVAAVCARARELVDAFEPVGFKASAFLPSYGLAEATLAVSIMPPGEGIRLELVEESELSGAGTPAQERPRRYRAIVNCGKPVIGMEVEVRDGDGSVMDERGIGKLFCRGSSVMDGPDTPTTTSSPSRRSMT